MSDQSKTGVLLTPDAAERTKKAVRWFEHNGGRPRAPNRQADDYMPPIRGILLEDLPDGGQADVAITTLDETTFIQEVEIDGDVAAGTFQLIFKGQTTSPIPFNATPTQMQLALAALSSIGGAFNVGVRLGKQTYSNASTGNSFGASPGIWLVEFLGTFAESSTPPPLMSFVNGLTFTSNPLGLLSTITISNSQHWVDTGAVDTINAIVPVGSPTPMRLGAVVFGVWMPGVGYVVASCEARVFSQTYY